MESIWHDLSWVLPLRSDGVTGVMRVFTWIGYSTFYMLFLPLGFWLWRKPAFTRLAVIVAVSGTLNYFLKDFWQDPRPDVAMSLDGLVGESFGMPSGHAQTSFVLWVWLATEVRRGWMWAVAAVMVTGIAASRLYLGVHDIEDVVVGLALGAAVVVVGKVAMQVMLLPYLKIALIMLAGQAVHLARLTRRRDGIWRLCCCLAAGRGMATPHYWADRARWLAKGGHGGGRPDWTDDPVRRAEKGR